jgi:hypothetical protein
MESTRAQIPRFGLLKLQGDDEVMDQDCILTSPSSRFPTHIVYFEGEIQCNIGGPTTNLQWRTPRAMSYHQQPTKYWSNDSLPTG